MSPKKSNLSKNSQAAEQKSKNAAKASFFSSIRGKLLGLGCVSIATTVILGFTGIYLINSSNSNNQVLADINQINLLQNENQTLDVSFLYDLDTSYNDTKMDNLKQMSSAAENALKYTKSGFRSDLKEISDNIDTTINNSSDLFSSISDRGFSADAGMYADFLAPDEELENCFSDMSGKSEWIDGTWVDFPLASAETVNIDGVNYRHITYTNTYEGNGKRDYLIVRAGGNGIQYTGKVIFNNIVVNGTDVLDLSSLSTNDLAKSYGEGYTDLNVTTFNKLPSISFQGAYTSSNPDWQEASIEIPIDKSSFDVCQNVSVDIYFEETELPTFRAAVALNGRYDFNSNLESLNKDFDAYSKSVAEGNDSTDAASAIQSKLEEIKNIISLYIVDPDIISAGTSAVSQKEDAFSSMQDYDKNIIELKSENNEINNNLTNVTSDVRSITNLTDNFQNTMSVMDEVVQATLEQNEKLNETQTQFDIVRGGIDQSRDKTSVIKSSIEECNKVIINVNQLMINLSAISEENAASTTETADSMQTLNRTINDLLNESKKLLAASSDLEKDMQSFIL